MWIKSEKGELYNLDQAYRIYVTANDVYLAFLGIQSIPIKSCDSPEGALRFVTQIGEALEHRDQVFDVTTPHVHNGKAAQPDDEQPGPAQ